MTDGFIEKGILFLATWGNKKWEMTAYWDPYAGFWGLSLHMAWICGYVF